MDIQSNSLPLPANSLTMEQKFGKNSIDIEVLREFCERECKEVTYRKGDQMEREGDPARWFGFLQNNNDQFTGLLLCFVC